MPLVKKPKMTEKKLAAQRRNAEKSGGPATADGKERIGAAQLRHGLYAKSPEVARRLLGEDPAEYEELLEGLRREFHPSGALQERLVDRLARVLLLMDRSERRQEGDLLRRAKIAEGGRENRLHARLMRLKMTAETLRSLARSVAERHYVTTKEDLEVIKKLHQEGVMTEMGEIALTLFHQLREPWTDENCVSELEKAQKIVDDVKMMFGIGKWAPQHANPAPAQTSIVPQAPPPQPQVAGPPEDEEEDSEKDDRYPNISEEDWIARERARKLLKNILTRQVEVCESQRKTLLRESLEGPTSIELAAEIAPAPAEVLLSRRVQDANMREVRRLTNLLLKIQRPERTRKLRG